MTDPIRYAVSDGVATITLDNPEQRNALSEAMVSGLRSALARAAEDAYARCVVLASSHESVWCAGGDLNAFSSDAPLIAKHHGFQNTMELFATVADYPKPTIAALNGHALAGGMGLACCCDLLIASERAMLGTPEINIGVFPFMIMAVIFRAVPQKRANELLMRGERITAQEAHEFGLINRVVAPEAFDATVTEWASSLAAKSPLLMQIGKRAMAYQRDLPLPGALEYLRSQLTLAQSTDDIREGVEAFFAKRDPVWSGR